MSTHMYWFPVLMTNVLFLEMKKGCFQRQTGKLRKIYVILLFDPCSYLIFTYFLKHALILTNALIQFSLFSKAFSYSGRSLMRESIVLMSEYSYNI